MLTLLTTTGCRPEAWAICEKLMMRQTYSGAIRWIVVDDGEQPQQITFKRENWLLMVVRPEPYWKPGQNTQARNLRAGLEFVEDHEKLVIIEDDDLYGSEYLQKVSEWLDGAELVGECKARYYNYRTRKYRQLSNMHHASLCSSAMTGRAIDHLRKECRDNIQFIDINLWRNFHGKKQLYSSKMVVGIKGLPGRTGIGMGHKSEFAGLVDKDGSILRQWAGNNADLYL